MQFDHVQSYLPNLDQAIERSPVTVTPQTPLTEVLDLMNPVPSPQAVSNDLRVDESSPSHRVSSSCVLVLDRSRLVGLLTEQDIVRLVAVGSNWAEITVGEVMTQPLITLTFMKSDGQDISRALQIMRKHQIRHLPIVGDDDRLFGLVTFDSIRRLLQPTNLFRLRRVTEVMTSQVVHAPATVSVLSLCQLITQYRVGCVVITEPLSIEESRNRSTRFQPVGIVSEQDIIRFQTLGLDLARTQAHSVMTAPKTRLKPDDSLWTALQEMQRLQVRRLVVTGEWGELRGLVSQSSMLQALDPSDIYEVIQTLRQTVEKQGDQLVQTDQQLQREAAERKLLEDKLQANQMEMRAVFEAMTDIILMLDVRGDQIQVMPTHPALLSKPSLDLISPTLELFLGSASADQFLSQIRLALETKQTVNFEYHLTVTSQSETAEVGGASTSSHNPGPEEIWFAASISPISVDTVIWVARDISDRKGIEQALYQEKELAQVTLHSIGDAVITTDALGKVKYFNPVAEQLTGWRMDEAIGRSLSEVFKIVSEKTRKPVENPVEKVLHEGRIVGLANHTVLISRQGTEYAIDDSAAPIRDRQGQMVGAVLVFRDVSESRQLEHQLSWQASHDALTGLVNRREFERQLFEAIDSAKQEEYQHALCYLDLDQFKVVNDTCGHVGGDELLRQVTTLLKQQVRSTDTLARLGGDEFGLLLLGCPISQAEQIADTLRQLIEDFRFTWQGKTFTLGVSIGVVAIEADSRDLASVLSAADAACYAAKERGRNCVHVYRSNDRELARQRLERQWISRLHHALEENRFCLHCQRIVPVIVGVKPDYYEVLLRLVNEDGQLIPPGAFIPAAERYDLMSAIDRWVIRTFFADYEGYCQQQKDKSLCTSLYAINLSGTSLNNNKFFSFLKAQFAQYQISPQNICFEITETAAIANLSQAAQFIDELQQLGCRFALDDFGNGMSSLAYLKHLPVDYLKIDGSFVKNLTSDPIDRAMVESFNRIAHVMGIQTIAEFVEDEATLAQLRVLGVDYAQGYGIDRPSPLFSN